MAAKYGISMMTYYSWRKKAGPPGKKGPRERATASSNGKGSTGDLRKVIKERVRLLAPAIVRDEVMAYLAETLGRPSGRGRSRR